MYTYAYGKHNSKGPSQKKFCDEQSRDRVFIAEHSQYKLYIWSSYKS